MKKNKVYMGLLHFPVGMSFEFQLKAADRETIEAVLNDLKDDPGKEQRLKRRLKELAAGEEPISRDLNCLITVPASDVNFQGALERADATTINAALAAIVGKPETKTKELELRRRLKKLIQSTDKEKSVKGIGKLNLKDVPVSEAEKRDPALHMEMETLRAERDQHHQTRAEQEDRERLIAQSHEMIGRIQGMEMIAKMATVSTLVWLRDVKAAKIYRDLPNIGTWEDFCKYLKKDRRTVDEDLQNLAAFGENFLETVASLQVGYRDLRKLRQLSHDGTVTIEGECLRIGDEAIPINDDHAEDLQAAIERIIEDKDKISTRVEKLEKQFEAAVKEETKGLNEEKKALVKEVKRLKAFDPEEKDREWSVKQMIEIEKATNEYTALVGRYIIDPRLQDDRNLQARVSGHLQEAELSLHDLRLQLDRIINMFTD